MEEEDKCQAAVPVAAKEEMDSGGGQEEEEVEGSAVLAGEFSNANLLKVQTHDRFSTPTALKKLIAKKLPPPLTNAPPLPLLDGMVRLGKSPKASYAFFAFETPQQRDEAAAKLAQMVYRSSPWTIENVTEDDLKVTHHAPRKSKRPRDEVDGGGKEGGVAPWAAFPYEEQLLRKRSHCLSVVKKVIVHQPGVMRREFFKFFTEVVPSVVQDGYRNHVNLTCGYDKAGAPAIGFNEGCIVDGVVCIEPVDPRAQPPNHRLVEYVARQLMRLHDKFHPTLKMMDRRKPDAPGFWRRVQVRHSVRWEVMVDVEFSPDGVGEATLAEVKAALVELLTTAAAKEAAKEALGLPVVVVSLQCHLWSGTLITPPDCPREVLFGAPTLTESLCGLHFELGPTAFFQVNTATTEVMLQRVAELAALSPNSLLFDLCCGTGTIGLCLARHVSRVIGIEMVEAAVRNAEANAVTNNVGNATFRAGRVEEVLPSLLFNTPIPEGDIVAILDPPRAGMHPSVIRHLRGVEKIRRLVYISCDQRALETDCPGLLKPPSNTYSGAPFKVVTSFGVDLFPHTPHVEMVVVMERAH